MRYMTRFDLNYEELKPGEDLYDDVDLESTDMVEARYRKDGSFPENPCIACLPRPYTAAEIRKINDIGLVGYDERAVSDMPIQDRKRQLYRIRDIRIPLPFHAKVDSMLSGVLISSYARRRIGISGYPRKISLCGEEKDTRTISCGGDAATGFGFSLIGAAGSGKTTAIDLVLKKYPKVICHKFDDCFFIQIPFIRLTAYSNSNLTALFQSFARQLDMLLDSGNNHYRQIHTRQNLGQITSIVCGWIELYHIGAIIIDEMQLLDFSGSSVKSFENILTVMAQTGVGIVTVGTPDAIRAWGGKLRIYRRLGSEIIKADDYCRDEKFIQYVIGRIWKYQWTSERLPAPDEDVMEAMYEESLGSIDLLLTLWMQIQFSLMSVKTPHVDAPFIHRIGREKLGELKRLLGSELKESTAAYESHRRAIAEEIERSASEDEEAAVRAAADKEAQEDIILHYDRDRVLSELTTIFNGAYPIYSDDMIRKAFRKAENIENFKKMQNSERVGLMLDYLKKAQRRKNTGKGKTTVIDRDTLESIEEDLKTAQ